jgi:hypothetical protein
VQQQPIYDVSIPDVRFAWISTLFFPTKKKLDHLVKDDWGLKKIRKMAFGLGNVVALKDNVPMAKENLNLLLGEIDKRNKQFFMFFTPAPATEGTTEGKKFLEELQQVTTYQDMKNENASLLEWFSVQIRALTHFNDRHALPPLQQKLVEYLKTDWSRTDLRAPHW